MNRRRLGVLVLATVAVAAVIVPGWFGTTVIGTAGAAPPAPAPRVGDCVTRPLDELRAGAGEVPVTGPCTGVRYGEVETVLSADTPAAGQIDPAWATCAGGIDGYLGLPAGSAQGQAFGHWMPTLVVDAPLVLHPGVRQQAAGQRWSACVLAPAGAAGAKPVAYRTPLRQWLVSGAPDLAQPTCERAGTGAECGAPHDLELLGTSLGAADFDDLRGSCAQLVTALTGLAPTVASQVRIRVDVGNAPAPASGRLTTDQVAYCVVAAPPDRLLAASLIGLHDHPLPLIPS